MTSKPHEPLDDEPPPKKTPTSPPNISLNPSQKRNAFTALMTPSLPTPPSLPTAPHTFHGRNGLGAYIASPSSYPSSRVLTHTPTTVTIHDLFPKASIHLLLLPRDSSKTLLHPTIALSDATFLSHLKPEISNLKALAAKELKRRFGAFSATEKAREVALRHNESFPEDPVPVPPGRDYAKDVRAGIHSGPSMAHLHIHVVSIDSHSVCVKHRKHYNSFHTPFFIDVEDFPLGEDDERRHPGREGYLKRELVCWRCGKGFGSGFKALKEHLEVEFEEWKKV